jgi:hypothetical protein
LVATALEPDPYTVQISLLVALFHFVPYYCAAHSAGDRCHRITSTTANLVAKHSAYHSADNSSGDVVRVDA